MARAPSRSPAAAPPAYHLVGVAGVGMNALAQVAAAQGARVSGSDRHRDAGRPLAVLDKLEQAGVVLVPQDGRGVRPGLAAVVVSSAIEPDNPDLAAARRLAIPVMHRAALLARWANAGVSIAVTGTAGKTTVVGMLGWTLARLGADPTVVNGGALVNWKTRRVIGNVRIGRSGLWVVEADESDRSLLRFRPNWAVITNLSRDHFEPRETARLFRAFAARTRRGVIGLYGDGPPAPPPADVVLAAGGLRFTYRGVDFALPLAGRHNVDNALHCIRVCERLGYGLEAVRQALRGFRGIERRLERIGCRRRITVFDDYAHNPAKIAAAWTAVAPHCRRVLAAWRPHGFGPLALMADDLVRTFAALMRPQDRLWLLPVYYAGGTARRAATSATLAAALRRAGVPVALAASHAALRARLRAAARPGDAVLFMGARDPALPESARRFLAQLA